jgi:diaminopimelate decarboxylase
LVEAELGIRFEFVNIGGGFGIPYKPEQAALDIDRMSQEIIAQFDAFKKQHGYAPRMYMESGRFMTGPHGCLVTTAINHKNTYRKYVGVDACMSSLMRPALYDAYHHIDVIGKNAQQATEVYDVVGSLCENNDKFAVQRELPIIEEGDLVVMHDTGAHGHAMGFQYNGRLRPKELLLRTDGSVELIRREEQLEDYFATLKFSENNFAPSAS